MRNAYNEKRKTTYNGRNRTIKSRTLGEMDTYKYLGVLVGDIIKHAEMKEKK